MPKVTPLAVRLARLDPNNQRASQIQTVLNFCSSDMREKLDMSSDEEIYAVFAGHYPKLEFYQKLNAQSEEPEPYVLSEELRRVLAIMDTHTVFANNSDLLGALEIVMLPSIREQIRRCPEDLLRIICHGRLGDKTIAEGDLHGFSITVTVPPELDSYLEIVFAHIEECS